MSSRSALKFGNFRELRTDGVKNIRIDAPAFLGVQAAAVEAGAVPLMHRRGSKCILYITGWGGLVWSL